MRAVVRVALVALCCVLMVPAIAEAAAKPPSPTQIVLVGADLESISGELRSTGKGCLRERTVNFRDISTNVLFHTTTTDRDGRFSIALDDIPFGTSVVRVRVTPKTIGGRLCEQDTARVTFDEATLTGGASDGAFRGVLSSSVAACEPNRLISLYEVSADDPVFVGFNFTDASGAWVIQQASGNYEARADLAFIGGGDAYFYCEPVVSPRWSFEEPPEESA
jgi:hypothetical protein